MSFDIESLYKSILRHVQDTIQEVKDKGISDTLTYYSWESRGETQEIPAKDLLGLSGWTFRENGGLWEVRAGLTLSTINDKNLLREIKILDTIHNKWGEGSKIKMLDRLSGMEFTEMVVSDFDIMPSGTSEKRNYRPIGIELLRTES